jgi:hypothetical protein
LILSGDEVSVNRISRATDRIRPVVGSRRNRPLADNYAIGLMNRQATWFDGTMPMWHEGRLRTILGARL